MFLQYFVGVLFMSAFAFASSTVDVNSLTCEEGQSSMRRFKGALVHAKGLFFEPRTEFIISGYPVECGDFLESPSPDHYLPIPTYLRATDGWCFIGYACGIEESDDD